MTMGQISPVLEMQRLDSMVLRISPLRSISVMVKPAWQNVSIELNVECTVLRGWSI
jgi:hypothetical protein